MPREFIELRHSEKSEKVAHEPIKDSSQENGVAPSQSRSSLPTLQPSQDIIDRAHEAFEAMRGGVTGWGCDRERLFNALRGLTKDDAKVLIATYAEMYRSDETHHRDLIKDIKHELGGLRESAALAYIDGATARGDTLRVRCILNEPVNMSAYHLRTFLGSLTPIERRSLATEYLTVRPQGIVADITKNYTVPSDDVLKSRDILVALAEGRDRDAELLTLKGAVEHRGKNPDEVYSILEHTAHTAQPDIRDDFNGVAHYSIEKRASDKFARIDAERASALARGDIIEAKTLSLVKELSRRHPRTPLLIAAIEGTSDAEREDIKSRFSKHPNGGDLERTVEAKVKGIDKERILLILQKGKLSDEETIFFSLRERHVPLPTLSKILADKSRNEIEVLDRKYQTLDHVGFSEAGRIHLSGRNRHEFLSLLKGKAETVREEVARLKDDADFEKKGASGYLTNHLTAQGKFLRFSLEQASKGLDEAQEDKVITPEEEASLQTEIRYIRAHQTEFRRTKDGIAEIMSDTTTGVVAASVAMTGVGLIPVAGATAAGAFTYPITEAIAKGPSFDTHEIGNDLGKGALRGAISAAGAIGAKALTAAAEPILQRPAQTAIKSATSGVLLKNGSQ